MRRVVLAALCALALMIATLPALALTSRPGGRPGAGPAPLHEATGEAVEGSYIVVLEAAGSPAAVAADVAVTPRHVYRHVLNGFAARLDGRQLERVRRDPRVRYVEEDQVATAAEFIQTGAPWNLDRIDQRTQPLDGSYSWNGNAAGVNAYVLDTGIQTDLLELTGRADVFFDVLGGDGQDCNGHGTHVAGTIGALTYGVAKTVRLWSVRVLDCYGSGSYAGVIAATDYVAANHEKPAVANYSLGGGYSASLNAAVTNLVDSGVFVSVAAGHSGADACNYSPGSADGVMTVGATDKTDVRPWWSNYGPCVEIWAPGVNITSVWLGGGTRTISGTSHAAPHAAGVAALVHALGGGTDPFAWIMANATTLTDPGGEFPFLYKSDL